MPLIAADRSLEHHMAPTPAEGPAALTSRLISVSFQGKPAGPRHLGWWPGCLASSRNLPSPGTVMGANSGVHIRLNMASAGGPCRQRHG